MEISGLLSTVISIANFRRLAGLTKPNQAFSAYVRTHHERRPVMRKPKPPATQAFAAPRPPRPKPPAAPQARPAQPKSDMPGGPWLWGWHAVVAALRNPERKLLRLVATDGAATALAAEPDLSETTTPQIIEREALDRMLPTGAVHQGLALIAKPLRPVLVEDVIEQADSAPNGVVVVLDQVSDPHNVGAVLRSAAAFGALAVIVPERNVPDISGTLAKSASGALEHVPLVRVVNLVRALDQLKQAGFWTVGLDGTAERTLASHKLSGKIVLVMGSEGDGLRRLTRESCDLMARLPTGGPIASLNVSNAAAIALYELARDR